MATDLGKIDININEFGGGGGGGSSGAGPAPGRGMGGIGNMLLRFNEQRLAMAQEIGGFARRPTLAGIGEIAGEGTATRTLAGNLARSLTRGMAGAVESSGKTIVQGMLSRGIAPGMSKHIATTLGPGGVLPRAILGLGKVLLPVGIALAVVGSAAYVVVKTLMKVREMMRSLTDEVRDISPQVALGEAQADLIRLRAQLETNASVGHLLGQQVNAQARLDAAIMRFKATAVETLGPYVLMAMEGMINIVNSFVEGIRAVLDAIGGPGGLMASIGTFIKSIYSSPLIKAMALFNPALGAVAGPMQLLGEQLERMGQDVAQIKRNTRPDEIGDSNQPFLQDLRFMGVPI